MACAQSRECREIGVLGHDDRAGRAGMVTDRGIGSGQQTGLRNMLGCDRPLSEIVQDWEEFEHR